MDPLDPGSYTADNWPQAFVLIAFLLIVVGLPSLLSWLGNRRVKNIEHEVVPNAGGSLRDSVDRIEAALTDHIQQADERDSMRDATLASIDARLAKVETDAAHAAEPKGLFKRLL